MTRYLLDTDAVIDVFNGYSPTVDLVQGLYEQGDTLCTCAVVMAEVYAGLHPPERERGQVFLRSLQFLATPPGAARQAGLWRYDFARQGIQLATTDCLIAAIAHNHGTTLITGNIDDFPLPGLSRLRLPRGQRGRE
ncbi:MAG: PIN domain-containing protein [Thermomicrobiales bacterium]